MLDEKFEFEPLKETNLGVTRAKDTALNGIGLITNRCLGKEAALADRFDWQKSRLKMEMRVFLTIISSSAP